MLSGTIARKIVACNNRRTPGTCWPNILLHPMKTLLAPALALLLFACCGAPTETSITNATPEAEPAAKAPVAAPDFQAILDKALADHPEATGIMLHVEAPGQNISWSGAVGIDDKSAPTAVDPLQPALIASNTKTYVSAATLRLVELGNFSLTSPIGGLLSEPTATLLQTDGYDLNAITIQHLLSHTSGMFDYVAAPVYMERAVADPWHEWTRDEQIALGISDGEKLGDPGSTFSYADMNYVLLTEIMEQQTGKPFFTAMRELLKYEDLQLNETWFIELEEAPVGMLARVHQYATEIGIASYTMSPTFDLYGGGGICATTRDLALFSQHLFTGQLFDKAETLDLIYTKIETQDAEPTNYHLGLAKEASNGLESWGHGGFWGTEVRYIPELDASVAVFVLERDAKPTRKGMFDLVAAALMENRAS